MAPKLNMPGVAERREVVAIPTDNNVSAMERVKALLQSGMSAEENNKSWGSSLINSSLKLDSVSTNPSRAIFTFTVQPEHCNRLGNLHGGCTSTIFDICTTSSLAPIAKPGFWFCAGVSRTLNVTYLRPIPLGEKVRIEAEVVHAGKRLCTLIGKIVREKDGAVLATCEHGKVTIDPEVGGKL